MSGATRLGEAQNPAGPVEVCPAVNRRELSILGSGEAQIRTEADSARVSTGPTGWTL
jgi:hypothetical protein